MSTKEPQEKSRRAKLHTPPASPLPPVPDSKGSPSISPINSDCPSTDVSTQASTQPSTSPAPPAATSPSEAEIPATTTAPPQPTIGDLLGATPTKPSPRRGRLQTHHYKTICTVRHTPPTTPLPLPPLPQHQTPSTPNSTTTGTTQSQIPPPPPPQPPQSQQPQTPLRKTSSSTSSASSSSSSSLSSPQVPLTSEPREVVRTLSRTNSEVFGRGGSPRGQRASQVVPRLRLSNAPGEVDDEALSRHTAAAAGADAGAGTGAAEHCHIQAVNRSSSALDLVAMAAVKHPHSARLPVPDAPEFAGTPRGHGSHGGSGGGGSSGTSVPALTHSTSLIQTHSQSAKGSELGTPRRFGSIKKFFTMHPADKSSSSTNSSPRRGPLRAMIKNRITGSSGSGGAGGTAGTGAVPPLALAEGQDMATSPRQQQSEQQQAPNMLTMMFSPELKENFRCFLKGKFADENILFVDDCARFAETEFATQHALEAAAKHIYDTYVREGAPLELNIGYEQRRPLEEALFSSSSPQLSQPPQQSPQPSTTAAKATIAAEATAAAIRQAVFEDLALEIRNFMEVAFLPAWVAAGAWREIPHEHYAPNLPSLQQVLGSRRMLNQLLLYVAAHGGARLAEALVLCDRFVKEPSAMEVFDETVEVCREALHKKVAVAKTRSDDGKNENENEESKSLSPEECVDIVVKLKKKVCKVLESKYYLDWVVRKTWTCVYIPPHHSHHENSRRQKEEEEEKEEKEKKGEKEGKCKNKGKEEQSKDQDSRQECDHHQQQEEEENCDDDRE